MYNYAKNLPTLVKWKISFDQIESKALRKPAPYYSRYTPVLCGSLILLITGGFQLLNSFKNQRTLGFWKFSKNHGVSQMEPANNQRHRIGLLTRFFVFFFFFSNPGFKGSKPIVSWFWWTILSRVYLYPTLIHAFHSRLPKERNSQHG